MLRKKFDHKAIEQPRLRYLAALAGAWQCSQFSPQATGPDYSRFAVPLAIPRSMGKKSRDQLIAKAVTNCGYSQIELANFLDLHYSTISRILASRLGQQK